MLLLNGLIRDFNFAARLEGRSEIFSTQMYLPMPDGRTTLANFFSPLVNNLEKMYLTGKDDLSAGAHAADYRTHRGGRGKPLPRIRPATTHRTWPSGTSPPKSPLSGEPSVMPNVSQLLPRFIAIFRTRSMRPTASWWAIRTRASGIARI